MDTQRSSSSSSGEGGRGRREERRREGEGDGWIPQRVGVDGGNKRGSGLRAGSEGKGGGGRCRGQREEATIERTDRLMVPVFCSRKTVAVGQSGVQEGSHPQPAARLPVCPRAPCPPPPPPPHHLAPNANAPIKAQPTPRTTLAARPLAAPFLFSPAQVSPCVSVSGRCLSGGMTSGRAPQKHQPPDHTPVREAGPCANKGRGKATKKRDISISSGSNTQMCSICKTIPPS